MLCAYCNGTAHDPERADVCPVCRGSGKLPDRNDPLCPFCIGTGHDPHKATPCRKCGGSGRLPSEPTGIEVIFVEAGSKRTAHLKLEELFKELKGELRVCDPYYGTGSLARLDLLTHCKTVRFLTRQADSKERSFIDKNVKEFVSQHPNVELRKASSNNLHDRYILADDEIIMLGNGLKDVGAKDSFVIRLKREMCEDIIGALRASFDDKWATATPLT